MAFPYNVHDSNHLKRQFLATVESNRDRTYVARSIIIVCDHLQPPICPRVAVRQDLVRLSEKWWNIKRCPKERYPLVLMSTIYIVRRGLSVVSTCVLSPQGHWTPWYVR